ncbi:MAG: PHB depolymerase family esterase [Polyangiaceae bacterium]
MRALDFSTLVASLALAVTVSACGDDASGGAGGGGAAQGGSGSGAASSGGAGGGQASGGAPSDGGAADGGAGGGMTVTTDFIAGGDRPVSVKVPTGYDPAVPAPLVILLHGYSATGALQNAYFGMESVADEKGIVFAYPDGTIDPQTNHFWNATDACCDLYGSGVDDVGYLTGLLDEIEATVNIDPKRVYFVGHSNGGFMSYRMACELSDRIAAIASLAGATFADDADCGATNPVSVLQIHGTADATILYAGGGIVGNMYPGAETSVATWAARSNCGPLTPTNEMLDIDSVLVGNETTVLAHTGCQGSQAYELWRIEGGAHVPSLAAGFSDKVLDFLLAHPKP